jgi:cation diffusion facilitator family transporter
LNQEFRAYLGALGQGQNRRTVSRQVLLVMLWLTLLVLAVKVWAGWATSSLSLLAESLHTLIDGFSTVLSLIAVASPHRSSGRQIWGHSKVETGLTLMLVAALGFAGFGLMGGAVWQLATVTNLPTALPVQVTLPLLYLLAVVFLAIVGLALFERQLASRLESAALRWNANHILQDSWLMLVLLMGLVGVWSGYRWLDPLLAIVMVLMAGVSCWRVLIWQLPMLVQQTAIAPEAVSQMVKQIQGVTHCYRIQSRGIVGRQVLVEMSLVLHPEFAGAAQWIMEQIEAAIRDRYGPVQVLIHLDRQRAELQHPLDEVAIDNANPEPDWN